MSSEINYNRIAKNTIYLYFRMIVVLLLQFYITRRLLIVLGANDFGIYNVIGGIITMLSFFNTSLSNGFQRFFNVALGKKQFIYLTKLFSSANVIQIFTCIFFFIIAETIGLWFVNNELNIIESRLHAANWVYQCTVFSFMITMLRVPFSAIVVAYEQMNFYALLSVVEVLLNLLNVLLLPSIHSDSLILYAIFHLSITFISYIIYVVYVLKKNPYISYSLTIDRSIIKKISSFSGWNLFGAVAHIFKTQGVNILLNLFFGTTVNASKGIASQVQSGLTQLYSNFQMASRPQAIQLYAVNNIEGMNRIVFSITRYSFLLLWLFAFPIMVNMDEILFLWLGNNYPIYTSIFCRLSIIIALIESFANPISTIVHATGSMKKYQIVCSSIILLIIPTSYLFLANDYAPQTAMYVSIFILIFVHIVRLLLVRKLVAFSIKTYLYSVIKPCVVVIIISFAIFFPLYRIDMSIFIKILSLIISNIVIIIYFGLNINERQLLSNKIQSIFKGKNNIK